MSTATPTKIPDTFPSDWVNNSSKENTDTNDNEDDGRDWYLNFEWKKKTHNGRCKSKKHALQSYYHWRDKDSGDWELTYPDGIVIVPIREAKNVTIKCQPKM